MPSHAVQPLAATYYTPPGVGPAPEQWWQQRLADPALARLVEAALANAPDLAAALARVEQARAGLAASEAERLPLLNGSASVTYNRSATQEFGFQTGPGQGPVIDTERVLYRAGVEASWDADIFGRLRADTRAAQARLDAAGFDAAAVRLALVTDVARNLAAARAAVAREAIARENVRSVQDTLALTRDRVRAGLNPGSDAVRAESLVAEQVAAVPLTEAERTARIAALTTLTGLAPADIAPLVLAAPTQVPLDTPTAGLPSDLLLRRPDIAASLARIAAADQDIASAVAARFPRLTITSTLGLVAAALGDLFTGDALGIVAGPGLAGPLLDFGRNRARVAQARAAATESVAVYRGTVLRAFGEVETGLATVQARQRQRTALLRQRALAEDAVRLARSQYRAGLTDFLGVLDAERTANRVRDQIAAAEAELVDAQLALYRSVGGQALASGQNAASGG